MTYGLWLSAGGLQVNEYRQTLSANNMANLDTAGFKNDLALIHERRVESAVDGMQMPYAHGLLDSMTGGSWVRPTFTNMEQGGFEETGRSMDVAIDGKGFFAVQDGSETRYTRDGRFALNPARELVLAAGDGRYKVLDADGSPITLGSPALGQVNIGGDGTITQGDTVVARLGVTDFENYQNLRKVGNSVFQNVGNESGDPATARIRGGFIERSTVDPVTALTNMIEVSRAYELNAKMITLQDETLSQAVTRVGRVA